MLPRFISGQIVTTIMLDRTRHAAKELSGRTPTDGEIWKSLNHKDISRTTRAYVWRGMHQATKLGNTGETFLLLSTGPNADTARSTTL
jgi:ribonuclease HI